MKKLFPERQTGLERDFQGDSTPPPPPPPRFMMLALAVRVHLDIKLNENLPICTR